MASVFTGANYMKPSCAKVPKKIVMPLDESIVKLKGIKRELPSNLYLMTSRHVYLIETISAIIEGMEIPERIKAST